jgi:hypothetical protein
MGVALAAVAAGATAAPAWAQSPQAPCTPKRNIEAIIDDSPSMAFANSDPRNLRRQAMEMFASLPWNDNKTLGALEFGGTAQQLFPPSVVGGSRADMVGAFESALRSDNEYTDYNVAFAQAKIENPSADAWIFLTDGAHTGGRDGEPYANGHQGGPPTYVVGFGPILQNRSDADGNGIPDDRDRLHAIVNDTHGWFPEGIPDDVNDPEGSGQDLLQALLMDISATFDCWAQPQRSSDTFNRAAQAKRHRTRLAPRVRSARIAATWTNESDRFSVQRIEVRRGGRVVAKTGRIKRSQRRRVRRLRVERTSGSTFATYSVKGLVRGTLAFRVKATRLGAPGTKAITQVATPRR